MGREKLKVTKGDKIAQFLYEWIFDPEIEVHILEDTKRVSGFGSTVLQRIKFMPRMKNEKLLKIKVLHKKYIYGRTECPIQMPVFFSISATIPKYK